MEHILTSKVDAIARAMLSPSFYERDAALARLRQLMEQPEAETFMDAEGAIDRALKDLGIPDHILGYSYLQVAIGAAVQEPELIHAITGRLYPLVAERCGTSCVRAERSIRHAIEQGWLRCDLSMHDRYFGGKVSASRGKPTNAEFIARLANIIRRQLTAAA